MKKDIKITRKSELFVAELTQTDSKQNGNFSFTFSGTGQTEEEAIDNLFNQVDNTINNLLALYNEQYENGIKKMSIKEFRELGFLQEINRRVLHPAGLALEIVIDENNIEQRLGGIWDYREDAAGIYYSYDLISKSKIESVDNLINKHKKERIRLLGSVIQEPK